MNNERFNKIPSIKGALIVLSDYSISAIVYSTCELHSVNYKSFFLKYYIPNYYTVMRIPLE